MNIQRLFSTILFVLSVTGIAGALSLDLLQKNNIGPGSLPLLYSALLAVCSAALFLNGGRAKTIRVRDFFRKPLLDGLFFFVMAVVFFVLAKYLGMFISLGIFGTVVLFQQNRMKKWQVVVFEIVFLIFIYMVFIQFLKIPFERGLFFD